MFAGTADLKGAFGFCEVPNFIIYISSRVHLKLFLLIIGLPSKDGCWSFFARLKSLCSAENRKFCTAENRKIKLITMRDGSKVVYWTRVFRSVKTRRRLLEKLEAEGKGRSRCHMEAHMWRRKEEQKVEKNGKDDKETIKLIRS